MKKTLENDLTSLARRIIKMDNKASVSELKQEARTLYEKLTLLDFVNKNIDESSFSSKEKKPEQSIADQFETERDDHHNPDGTEYNPEAISEPNTEKIKDIVSQMPPETEEVDNLVGSNYNNTDQETKEETESITGVSYDDLPDFEPVQKPLDNKSKDEHEEPDYKEEETSNEGIKEDQQAPDQTQQKKEKSSNHDKDENKETKKKSLNNKLVKDLKPGLNNRLAFTKHLFDGDKQALRNCIKDINNCKNLKEVKLYIEQDVKPKYNNWKGKEKYEERFFDFVATKFPE